MFLIFLGEPLLVQPPTKDPPKIIQVRTFQIFLRFSKLDLPKIFQNPHPQVYPRILFFGPNTSSPSSPSSPIFWSSSNPLNPISQESLSSWHIIYSYGDLAGGAWHTRPAREESLWRIWNLDPMPRPWQVRWSQGMGWWVKSVKYQRHRDRIDEC